MAVGRVTAEFLGKRGQCLVGYTLNAPDLWRFSSKLSAFPCAFKELNSMGFERR